MKYITIPATRPQYLEQVLESIKTNKNLEQHTLIIVLEPCYKKDLPDLSWINHIVIRNPETLGVDKNQYFTLEQAFNKPDCEYVIRLEDDLCVSPDVTALAEWYSKQKLNEEHMCMILYSGSKVYDNPKKIITCDYFSPWGDVVLPWQWQTHWKNNILNKENAKIFDCENNAGFDWCLNGYTIKNKLKCYTPYLSRISNIGVDGVYSNEWVWRNSFSGNVKNLEFFNSNDYII